MIDYFFRYNTEADAIAESEAGGKFGHRDAQGNWHWDLHYVLPDVKAWQPSKDTIVEGKVIHVYLNTWHAIVAYPTKLNALMNASGLAFALDRDAAIRGEKFVLKNTIGGVIKDIACEPIFAGANYPIGGWPDAAPEYAVSAPKLSAPTLTVT